jgi:hypothetical protein
VDCFEQDRSVRLLEEGRAEKRGGFGGVDNSGLFEQNVFSGGEGSERPFVVGTCGEGDVDCVDGWVVEKGCTFTLGLCNYSG